MNEALLRSLTPSVLGILGRRGADFAAAEDAVQDALVEAVRVWLAGPPRDPKGWLVTVAWRRFLDATARRAGGARGAARLTAPPRRGGDVPPRARRRPGDGGTVVRRGGPESTQPRRA